MEFLETRTVLTHSAVMTMLNAGIACAEAMSVPQCIVIVDASGELLGEIRMTGAKFLSRRSARAKALTAASNGVPTTSLPVTAHVPMAAATGGDVTGLPGGLPVRINGMVVGGIGVGSGPGDKDIEVARAALKSIGAELPD